jgi:hypothetical protein
MDIHNLYLIRVFRKSKRLFSAILLFIIFQTYFFLKREYSFPFFIWDMYSRTEQVSDTLVRNEIYLDDTLLNTTRLPIWQDAVLTNTFKAYWNLHENGNQDPVHDLVSRRTSAFSFAWQKKIGYNIENNKADMAQFPHWIYGYVCHIRKQPFSTIAYTKSIYILDRKTYTFTKTNSKVLFSIKKKKL